MFFLMFLIFASLNCLLYVYNNTNKGILLLLNMPNQSLAFSKQSSILLTVEIQPFSEIYDPKNA